MKDPINGSNYFFVDESGDPTFYDRHGNLIVGQAGCSPILILGFVEATDATPMRRGLEQLHLELAADEYLKNIPSMAKSNRAFHAKNDCPEVRQAVFKLIRAFEFRAQFIVARKRERVFRHSFHANENEFYDYLTSLLFENVLHRYTENRIYFSQRGTRSRQAPLESAIQQSIAKFETRWKRKISTRVQVIPHTSIGEPVLQVIDYMNWALYRAFVNREMRYFQFIQDKVSLVVDRYDSANYPKNWYTRENPFDIEKASPP